MQHATCRWPTHDFFILETTGRFRAEREPRAEEAARQGCCSPEPARGQGGITAGRGGSTSAAEGWACTGRRIGGSLARGARLDPGEAKVQRQRTGHGKLVGRANAPSGHGQSQSGLTSARLGRNRAGTGLRGMRTMGGDRIGGFAWGRIATARTRGELWPALRGEGGGLVKWTLGGAEC